MAKYYSKSGETISSYSNSCKMSIASYSKSGEMAPCTYSIPQISQKKVEIKEPYDGNTMKIEYKHLDNANPSNPSVWGPAMWFSLHNGASIYPINNPSGFWQNRMKSFIKGIPVMLPCEKCSDHASAYIESQINLDKVVSSRENLVNFFIDFHNFVNKRLGKPVMSYKDVHKMFRGTVDVLTVEWGPKK